jgi:hypothetical protein
MVQTRGGYNRWVQERGSNYETSDDEEECEACSERSSQSNQGSFSYNGGSQSSQRSSIFEDAPGGGGPSYSDNDRCRRHRKQDNDPKNVQVVSYRRRTARR